MKRLIRKGLWGLVPRLVRGLVKSPKATKALVKAYSNKGTGLGNPHIRELLSESLRDPELAARFMSLFNNGVAPSAQVLMDIDQTDNYFKQLQDLYPGINLSTDWGAPYNMESIRDRLGKQLENANDIINSYNQKIKFILDKDSRLFDVVLLSPQYTSLIYSDIKSGKIVDVDSYITSLVKNANTFMRRMDRNMRGDNMRGKPFTDEDFLTIRNGRMDVGSPAVVNEPSMRYGYDAYIYMPKFESSNWSSRFPLFNEPSIKVGFGMHLHGMLDALGDNNINNVPYRYIREKGVPGLYVPYTNLNYTHMVFKTPYEEDPISISDLYIAFPATDENILKFKPVFGRGFKKGGKIKQ